MEIYKGDIQSLYCEFVNDKNVVKVKNPKVRILHEENDNVYEDLPWQNMLPFDEGYVYAFDTNICKICGKYVVVFEGEYKDKKLNVIDEFTIIQKNIETENNILLYGFIFDIDTDKQLKNAVITIKNLDNNDIVYKVYSDVDGRWDVKIAPGDYEFEFNLYGYEVKTVRAQIGDAHKELQFNNVSLEGKSGLVGEGTYYIEDTFVAKNNLGIENIDVYIYDVSDVANPIIKTKTNQKGRWKVLLNIGAYIVKIILPSGLEKKFQLQVYSGGEKKIEEMSVKSFKNKTMNGIGTQKVTDLILDAHGNGIANANIQALRYNKEKDIYEFECEDYTSETGEFNLNLNEGKYKLVISHAKFVTNEQIITIGK